MNSAVLFPLVGIGWTIRVYFSLFVYLIILFSQFVSLYYYGFRFNLGKGNKRFFHLVLQHEVATLYADSGLPPVVTHLTSQDVDHAIDRGVNYLNWCGHPDGMSQAIRQLSNCQRGRIVIAIQFFARCQDRARRELDQLLKKLDTNWIDVLTFYYVETENE